MSWNLFIDDIRCPVTEEFWVIARSSDDAICAVKKLGMPDSISFDHDLGGDDTSIKFINWLVDYLMDTESEFPTNFQYFVHSANPVGSDNIRGKMDAIIPYFA